MTKRILSIDGGGIRGIIPARILAELERRLVETGKTRPLYTYFDLISGTSTGGIIALGLTMPDRNGGAPVATAAGLERLYAERGAEIFPMGLRQWLRTKFSLLALPAYSPEGLDHILAELLGERRLSDALGRVMVTAYDLYNRSAVFLNGAPGPKPAGETDYLAREAARATSAGPTYFPPAEVHPLPPKGIRPEDMVLPLVDGGVFANGPALAAYTEAIKLQCAGLWPADKPIEIISIGTGLSAHSYRLGASRRWGKLAWISPAKKSPIISVLMHGQQSTIPYQLNALLNGAADIGLPNGIRTVPKAGSDQQVYFRFNASLGDASDLMEDASEGNIKALQGIADQIIKDQSAELDAIVSRLT